MVGPLDGATDGAAIGAAVGAVDAVRLYVAYEALLAGDWDAAIMDCGLAAPLVRKLDVSVSASVRGKPSTSSKLIAGPHRQLAAHKSANGHKFNSLRNPFARMRNNITFPVEIMTSLPCDAMPLARWARQRLDGADSCLLREAMSAVLTWSG